MSFCPNCGTAMPDGAAVCPGCGKPFPAAPAASADSAAPRYDSPSYSYTADPKDHTSEFDSGDISDNKVFAMASYILGTIGIIFALLAAQKSPYAMFHVRQSIKLEIVSWLLGIISAVLCWTFIVPFAGGVCMVILFVVRIILFFQVCKGQAKEAPIVGNLGFLK